MLKKRDVALLYLVIISFILYTVSTFVENEFFINLLSPITVGLIVILLLREMNHLGPIKWACLPMIIGIFLWFVADIVYFSDLFIIKNPGTLSDLADEIYYYPNFFYAICITIFMVLPLIKNKIEIAFLLSNTLCFAIVGFVLIYRCYLFALGNSDNPIRYKEMFFFFLSFFTIIMCFQLFVHMGIRNLFKGALLANVGIVVFASINLYYDFAAALGIDPENGYVNLFYILSMMLMLIGTTIQVAKKYTYEFIPSDFSKSATQKRFGLMLFLIICDICMMVAGILSQNHGLYILITILSYLITNYVLYSEQLGLQMLENQRQQNIILEKHVQEKTQELKMANESLQRMSTIDNLTKLLNRRAYDDFLSKSLQECDNSHLNLALFCCDLNNFKPVNDTYGHEYGDKVLAELGKRMNELPDNFTSFRVGGDEFAICLSGLKGRIEAEALAENIRVLFNTPIISDQYTFHLSASVGIALYPDDCTDCDLLKSYADAAMYVIKKSKNKDGYKFFDSKMTSTINRTEAITNAVKKADSEKDFILRYQPQINAETGKLINVEVFPHLKGDLEDISPSELIPIAEECRLMGKLGMWILKKAMESIVDWNKKYNSNIGFTINLSPLQLTDPELLNNLERLCSEMNINKNLVTLDISNDVIVGATSSAREVMKALHNFGFQLSLNDFGGNNINLSYLMECGIDCIELSRKLIAEIENNADIRRLVESITKYAINMGLSVAAVGIENQYQYDLLKAMGVTKMQGYLICKPVSHNQFEDVLNQGKIIY